MNKFDMMKKMGLRDEMAGDGKNSEKIKSKIFNYLNESKNKIVSLENQITAGKNYEKLLDQVNQSKKKLQEAKRNFDKYEKKAEKYIEKNPKKAIAMAAAAGVLAAGLWVAFKGKKSAPAKKKAVLKKLK